MPIFFLVFIDLATTDIILVISAVVTVATVVVDIVAVAVITDVAVDGGDIAIIVVLAVADNGTWQPQQQKTGHNF